MLRVNKINIDTGIVIIPVKRAIMLIVVKCNLSNILLKY